MTRRTFSPAQNAYMAAKALYQVEHEIKDKYDLLIDEEGARLGLDVPFAILPENHPMLSHAQKLLDRENAAEKLMYEAAFNLFDWATETTFTKCGTKAQHDNIRDAVANVKKMVFVERHFEELVDMSMKLAA